MKGVHTFGLGGLSALPPYDKAIGVAHLVEALAEVNLLILRRVSTIPPLANAGIRYAEGSPWSDVVSVLRSGETDCRSAAAWALAEHRLAGREARVHVVVYPGGRMHVTVEVEGLHEDPSALLSGYT